MRTREMDDAGKHVDDEAPHADVVCLNVGGVRVTTHRSTLAMAPPESLLARAFAPGADPRWRLPRLPDGSHFLDLNPAYFLGALDVLRHGTRALAPLEAHVARGVALVADYLNMPALVAACADDLARREIAAAKPARVRTVSVAVIGADGTLPAGGFDLCDWSACSQVHVLDSWPVSRVHEAVATAVGIEAPRMEVHACWRRITGSVRPCAHVASGECEVPFDRVEWRGAKSKHVVGHARWVVRDARHVPEGEATTAVALSQGRVPFEPRAERVNVVFKRYDRATGTIGRCVVVGVGPGATVESALPKAMARLGMTADVRFASVYREHGLKVKRFDRKQVFSSAHFPIFWIADGDAGKVPPTSAVARPAHLLPPS